MHQQTEIIIGTAFEVMNELGSGFLEAVYHNSLAIALHQKGFQVQSEVPMPVLFRGVNVGNFKADLVINNEILIEVKAVEQIIGTHKAQVINYLVTSGLDIGLIINFGNPRVEIARLSSSTNSNRIKERFFQKSEVLSTPQDIQNRQMPR